MITELVDRLRAESKSMGIYGVDNMATLLTRAADTIELLSEKAREPIIFDDGTLFITVPDYSKVGRVLVGDSNNWGGLFYKEQLVEVVRCRDCKNFCGDEMYCHLDRYVSADDYCSKGERKEQSDEV